METVAFCTREEFESLLAQTKNIRHRVQILLMHDAGLRVTEVRTIRWNNFNFRTKVVTVKSLKKRGDKDKSRSIPLSDRLYDALAELIEKHPPTDKEEYLFHRGGKPVGRSSINNMMARIEDRAPEVGHVHPHKLRHTFATQLRANDAKLEDIKDLLGHARLDTTLIYAHAQPEHLRSLINAAQPKPTLWERIKAKLLPARQRRINWVSLDGSVMVGRTEEAKQLNDLVSRNISVVITGRIGVGKSKLLDSLKFTKPVLEVEDCKDWKKSLAGVLLYLFEGDKEAAAQMLFPDCDREKLMAKVNKESAISLTKLVCDVAGKHAYILKIGDIDSITPAVVKSLEILKDHFTIVTTARTLKMANTAFAWNFERVELKPLSRPDTLRLTHMLTQGLAPESPEYLRSKVWDISEGNPRMVQELCDRFRKEPVLSNDVIEEIAANYIGKQVQEIDMSLIFLILFGSLAVLRYVSSEVDNPSLKFIGGCFMIVLLFARYFFNSARRKAL
jgi:hypothetical protein